VSLQLVVSTGDSNFDGCTIPVLRLGNKDRSSNASRTHPEPHSAAAITWSRLTRPLDRPVGLAVRRGNRACQRDRSSSTVLASLYRDQYIGEPAVELPCQLFFGSELSSEW
jgi:hypothetical protein